MDLCLIARDTAQAQKAHTSKCWLAKEENRTGFGQGRGLIPAGRSSGSGGLGPRSTKGSGRSFSGDSCGF